MRAKNVNSMSCIVSCFIFRDVFCVRRQWTTHGNCVTTVAVATLLSLTTATKPRNRWAKTSFRCEHVFNYLSPERQIRLVELSRVVCVTPRQCFVFHSDIDDLNLSRYVDSDVLKAQSRKHRQSYRHADARRQQQHTAAAARITSNRATVTVFVTI